MSTPWSSSASGIGHISTAHADANPRRSARCEIDGKAATPLQLAPAERAPLPANCCELHCIAACFVSLLFFVPAGSIYLLQREAWTCMDQNASPRRAQSEAVEGAGGGGPHPRRDATVSSRVVGWNRIGTAMESPPSPRPWPSLLSYLSFGVIVAVPLRLPSGAGAPSRPRPRHQQPRAMPLG
jgi:hypothetical protein